MYAEQAARTLQLVMSRPQWHFLGCYPISPYGRCTCYRGDQCKRPGKHPIAREFPGGVKDAHSDPDRWRELLDTYPSTNIAVRTGPESDLCAVDLDGADGIEAFKRLIP